MKRLKARIAAKLKGNAGESLSEVLISLLIAALAMTMLAYAISSTSRIVTRSKDKMEKYYLANEGVTTNNVVKDSNNVELVSSAESTFTLTADDGTEGGATVKLMDNQNVVLYTNKEAGNKNKVISYKLKG